MPNAIRLSGRTFHAVLNAISRSDLLKAFIAIDVASKSNLRCSSHIPLKRVAKAGTISAA